MCSIFKLGKESGMGLLSRNRFCFEGRILLATAAMDICSKYEFKFAVCSVSLMIIEIASWVIRVLFLNWNSEDYFDASIS